MVDQQKNTSPDDEYQFPQDEYIASGAQGTSQQSVESEAPADVKDSGSEKLAGFASNLSPMLRRNKRVLIIIGLVLLVFLFLHFGMPKKITPVPIQPAPQPVVSTPVQQPINTPASPQIGSSETASDIKNLQSQIADLQSAVSQSRSDNEQLRNTVSALTEQMKAISFQLDKMMASNVKTSSAPKITYHLRAVISDRAWIISDAGQAQSITVGDEVKSYGKVTAIHQQHGIVETSSGRKIEYGPNDR